MPRKRRSPVAKTAEIEARLREAEDTLNAIRSGEVDALVVQGPAGDQVFTLKGADHRYRQLVETMNEGALMLADGGTIVYANTRFANLVRVPHERLLGSAISSYVAPSSRARLEALLHERASAKAEIDMVTADGAVVPVYLSATASWDDEHALTCLIATDLSDLRLLQRANEARAEAEAANRAKDEFLAMLGHELRNPLAPILTAVELMKRGSESTIARARDVIERQTKHVVMLVNDLLDVSRIAQGKVELHLKPVALADVVAKALESCSPLLEQRRHQIEVDVDRRHIVLADEARLSQVLCNLVTNAAKYTEREGRIEILGSRAGDQVALVVRDNGMGIAPDLLPTLFDRFVQSRRTIERSEGGLGLGLSIVRSLVALHGGTVVARSAGIGQGSELEVRLPAGDVVLDVPAATIQADARVDAESRRILIVDDNSDAAEMLADALAAMGHKTRVAFDGPSGLDAAVGFAPDIAFLDIGLPAMDGYELARRMRAELGAPHLRLVALTGYGQESDRERSAAAGFDSHMVKPINLVAVASTIKRLT